MSTSVLEIVELPDGDYALRRSEDEEAPLVRISFSGEAREMMEDQELTVAKAMITAGIQAVGQVTEGFDIEDGDADTDSAPDQPRTLH
ncbi:hypothetical protein C8D92_101452 [Tamilnaduibacter salinus]|uniref:Uncharacterized protein n=1 Tax=Tamilnaduibacter salinus TaxID=1484056 RepID=A0A2A2I216_9GAMM|nr:hypothetical protein [Tamilnaduibacter salinus]PAV25687.1 hypothetical protein CF392_09575 [Tamilnaduibacter salinus]PVY79239.1 hypothetical protein C8D92_101452 [Tamilnaduibacter salinus]